MTNAYRELLLNPEFQRAVPTEIRNFRAGEVIIEEGTVSSELYVLLEGKADVYAVIDLIDKPGQQIGISRIAEGEVAGELALFDQEPRTATVVAVADCKVAAMDGRILTEYMDRNPERGYWILKEMFSQIVRRMRQTTLRSNTITAIYLNDNAD
jgi:CRP-like cAMP-binding protein